MLTFYGIGTTLYGCRDKQADGSYVVTKWVVLFYFPLLPLSGHRVWPQGTDYSLFLRTVSYYQLVRQPLSWRQVLNWYLITAFMGPLMLYSFGGGLLLMAWRAWQP